MGGKNFELQNICMWSMKARKDTEISGKEWMLQSDL